MNGVSSVTDSPRPGQAHRVVTPGAIAAVEVIVKENRRITVNEIAAHLDMSHGSAHHVVHDKKLRFSFDSTSYVTQKTHRSLFFNGTPDIVSESYIYSFPRPYFV